MTKYIERSVAIIKLAALEVTKPNATMADVKRVVADVPAADVAPVVHGRWEESTDDWFETTVWTCSECREDYVLVEGTPKQNLWNYCPNCGAKMNEKEAVYD